MPRLTILAIAAVLLFGVGYAVARDREWTKARERIRDAELARDRAEAAADTTRRLWVSADSALQVFERRAIQAEVEKDRLDRDLRMERRVSSELTVALQEVRDSALSLVEVDEHDVRTATFNMRTPPLTVRANVALPPPPREAFMEMQAAIDPIPLTLRIGCRGEAFKQASVAVQAPVWADIQIQAPFVTEDVCNPLPARPTFMERIRIGTPYALGGVLVGGAAVLLLTR